MRHRAQVETLAMGCAGLGSFPKPQYGKTQGKDRHHLIQEQTQAGMEEARTSRMVGQKHQGAWTKWESLELGVSAGVAVRIEK